MTTSVFCQDNSFDFVGFAAILQASGNKLILLQKHDCNAKGKKKS